jgi:hypothetical protein
MGAAEKSGSTPGRTPPTPRYRAKALPATNKCHARHWRESSAKCGERHFKRFDALEANGRLGINNVIDQHGSDTQGFLNSRQRPRPPLRISAKNVDQDIRIY